MYTQFGQKVRFTILEKIGHKDALDTFWVFARIQLDTGETCLGSFQQSEFNAIKNPHIEMEAVMTHQVFGESLDLHSAFEPDAHSVLNLHIHPSYLNGYHPDSANFWTAVGATPSRPKRDSRVMRALKSFLR